MKGRTSKILQDEFPNLKKRYWGQYIWGTDYFVRTVGAVTEEMIRNYVETQSEKGETIPISFNYHFVRIFGENSNIGIIEYFISDYYNIPIEKVIENIEISNSKSPGRKEREDELNYARKEAMESGSTSGFDKGKINIAKKC